MNNTYATLCEKYGEVLRVKDVAEILKLNRGSVDTMLHNGTLPALKIGGQFRIKTESFVKWLNACENSNSKKLLNRAFASLDY